MLIAPPIEQFPKRLALVPSTASISSIDACGTRAHETQPPKGSLKGNAVDD
jgi:hypothetical protein